MIRAGRLRHSITIERQVSYVDEYNATVDEWRSVLCTRASIEPLNGREYFAASGEHSEVTTRIRMRWHPSLACEFTPKDRVNHDGRIYDILSIINESERDRELILMCKRGGTD